MEQIMVAVQIYSVRDEAEKDFKSTMKRIKEIGYDGVELAGLYGHTPEYVRDVLKDVGLKAVSAHVPYLDLLADMEGIVDQYAVIGCLYIAIPYLTQEYRPGNERFHEVVENIRKAGEICKKKQLVLLYHNHDFEFVKMDDGQYALDYLYAAVDAELLKTEIDTCWVNVSGIDPAEYILKYSGRCPIVHLKDYIGEKTENMYELIGIDNAAGSEAKSFAFRAVGHGVQDIPSILAASQKAGALWLVVEHDSHDDNTPLENIRLSREYLRSQGY